MHARVRANPKSGWCEACRVSCYVKWRVHCTRIPLCARWASPRVVLSECSSTKVTQNKPAHHSSSSSSACAHACSLCKSDFILAISSFSRLRSALPHAAASVSQSAHSATVDASTVDHLTREQGRTGRGEWRPVWRAVGGSRAGSARPRPRPPRESHSSPHASGRFFARPAPAA